MLELSLVEQLPLVETRGFGGLSDLTLDEFYWKQIPSSHLFKQHSLDGITEWIMMELPGTLTINDHVDGQNFGKLLWEKKDDGKEYVKTIIGRQLLQGECVELEKPFIVINRASQRKEKV
uniref:Uncharacterized protein n=1 Tax=Meloidogyne javanica TaxID=6303 RepID=A0A915LHB1_MELJA